MKFTAVLQVAVSAQDSDPARRAVVQRVLAILGYTDPPSAARCVWGDAPATIYTWAKSPAGDLVLVGGLVLDAADVVDSGGGKLERRAAPVRSGSPAPLFPGLSPRARERIKLALAPISERLSLCSLPSLAHLPAEKQEEARYWIGRALAVDVNVEAVAGVVAATPKDDIDFSYLKED